MGAFYQKLYQSCKQSCGQNLFSGIHFFNTIIDLVTQTCHNENIKIKKILQINDLPLSKIKNGGFILSELLSNALQHPFKNLSQGNVNIKITTPQERLKIVITDNGSGIPEKFIGSNPETTGLTIVRLLTLQEKGTLDFFTKQGTSVQAVI